MDNDIAPVHLKQRIDYLDVVRGISILFIFIANLEWFSCYDASRTGAYIFPKADRVVHFLQAMFIEGKFYSIFSLLFGWGMALQLGRHPAGGLPAARVIRRRLLVMALLGGIHLFFIWEGDIVFLYALLGFAVLFLSRYPNRVLLYIGTFLILSPMLLYYGKMQYPCLNFPADYMTRLGDSAYRYNGLVNQVQSRTAVLRDSHCVLDVVRVTLADVPYRFAYIFFVSRVPKVLGIMLLGFVVGRSEFYTVLLWKRRRLLVIIACSALFWLPANYALALYMQQQEDYYSLKADGWFQTIAYAIGVVPLALSYMALIGLLMRGERSNALLGCFAPVGRMAFSNYIFQSLAGIFIFYGIGLGYIQELGPTALTIVALGIFGTQAAFSNLWLKYFRFGPVEWLWRSLTYGKLQPFKNQDGL